MRGCAICCAAILSEKRLSRDGRGRRRGGARQSGELCLRPRCAGRDDARRKRPRPDRCAARRSPQLPPPHPALDGDGRTRGPDQTGSNAAPTTFSPKPFERASWSCGSATSSSTAGSLTRRRTGFASAVPLRPRPRRTLSRRRDRAPDRRRSGLLSSSRRGGRGGIRPRICRKSAQFGGNIRNVDVQDDPAAPQDRTRPALSRYLQTVRGTGYALKPE